MTNPLTGPVLVLLHAFPLDKGMWDDVVGPLADAGWDVVAPDLRGFGQSRYGPDGPDDEPTLAAMAQDVLAILDRLGVRTAVLGGVSMGGYVALEVLRQSPGRVAGLVLVDTKAGADAEPARENRLRVAEQVLAAGSTTALARAMVPTLLGATAASTRPDLVARVRTTIEASDPAAVAWAHRAMAARADSYAVLAEFAGPVLVVWGEEDVVASRADQDAMLAACRDGRFVLIPGAGRLSALEAPESVAAAIVAFLPGVSHGSGAPTG